MKTIVASKLAAAVVLSVAALLGGCANVTPAGQSPHLLVRQESAAIVVEGSGRVSGADVQCGPAGAGVCEATFEEVLGDTLVAEPAEGWRFGGWRRDVRRGALSPDGPSGDVVVYTATFERDAQHVAAGSASPARN